jgi:cyanophycin synthetase
MLSASGRQVGQATSLGLRVGGRLLAATDAADAASARRLLVNPFVDAMVMEISEIKVIREGLAFDRCAVAVLTNLGSGDHLGERYVDTRELSAKAIRAPLDVVLPDGFAVLNAGDEDVAAMAEKCKGGIVYFAPDGETGPLPEHLAKGGRAVFLSGSPAPAIISAHGGQVQRLFELERLRSPSLGLPPAFLENLLAAAAAGMALGLSTTAIRQGLESSRAAMDATLYADGDRRVLVTQARNPSALAAWVDVLTTSFPSRQRTALIEVSPDWRQEDAAEIGKLLRASFAKVVVVAPENHATIENLTRKIEHPALRREIDWSAALHRISEGAGPSDCIFVGPSKRAASDQANEHCQKRNMARLD